MASGSKFIWYELMTPDPKGSKAFYEAVVGWTIQPGQPDGPNGVEYDHIIRSDGGSNGGMLTLSPEMISGGARPGWLGYLYVSDVDAAAQAITADGGKLLMPPVSIDVGRFALVTDPQGVPIYIMTPTPPPGNEDAQSDVYDRRAVQHVSWNELTTSDVDAARAFYAKHFGFQFNDKFSMGQFGDYWFITEATVQEAIGAMMNKPPHVPMSGWNYYIHVGDIQEAKARVEAGGGQVVHGPMEVPGGDWVLNGIDSQGAPFALVGHKGA